MSLTTALNGCFENVILTRFYLIFAGAQRYVVQYRLRRATTDPFEVESSSTQVTITGLDPGRWYEFVVFSIGARGRRNEDGSDELHLQTGKHLFSVKKLVLSILKLCIVFLR